jgi:SAM-dependent methyltransferase
MTVTTAEVISIYDGIAPVYDARHDTPERRQQNQEVADLLRPSASGHVLDLGCGTGLLIDILGDRIRTDRYRGVDCSRGMLQQFVRKHPEYPITLGTAERVTLGCRHQDLIVALFGAASYIDWRALLRLPTNLAVGGRLFLMAYRPGYWPDYEPFRPAFTEAVQALTELATAYSWPLIQWRQFHVLDGIRWQE